MLNLKSTRLYLFSIIKLTYLKLKFLYFKSSIYNKKLLTYIPERFDYSPSTFLISPLVSLDNEIYEIKNISSKNIWDQETLNKYEFNNLHNFLWLTKIDRKNSSNTTQEIINYWIENNYNYNSTTWNMIITAKRIIAWSSNSDITLHKSNNLYKKKFFSSLIKQSNFLAKNIKDLPFNTNKIICAAAIILSGIIFKENKLNFEYGIKELKKIVLIYFDKTGFPKSRNPEDLFVAIKYLVLVREWLNESQNSVPEFLNDIILNSGRCYSFLKNFQKKLPLFNGAREIDHSKYDSFLKNFKYNFKINENELSGFYKIVKNKIELFFEAGNPPLNKFSKHYQAGALSFELSSKGEKIICNTGYGKYLSPRLSLLSRATAAHSTLYLNDTSSSLFEKNALIRKVYGNSLIKRHKILERELIENDENYILAAKHNGYEKKYGYIHKRSIRISKSQNIIHGTDELQKIKNILSPIHFFIRFHIYPGIKTVKTKGKNSILMKQKNGDGWIIKLLENNLNTAIKMSIEKNLFLARKNPINNECIYISGNTNKNNLIINWEIEKLN